MGHADVMFMKGYNYRW